MTRNESAAGRNGLRRGLAAKSGTALLALATLALPALAMTASSAVAQLSDSYKFLEAVRKKDGAKVEEAINEPGSTVVNTRDSGNGETALHIVAQRRDITWLSYLLGKGAKPNLRNDRGETALQIAADLGWRDGVEMLLANGASPDEVNDAGETPLISATHRRDTTMMQMLLQAGADPDRKDNSGRSARDYAKLDGSSSQLTDTIAQNVRKEAIRKSSGPVYGPTL